MPPPTTRGAERSSCGELLTSYFGSGRAAEAEAAFEQGRFRKAERLLSRSGNSPQVAFLRALASERAGSWKRAAASWKALLPGWPALRDRVLFHAGRAAAHARDLRSAKALLRRVPAASRVYAKARFALAKARRQAGDLPGALDALAPLSRRKPVLGEHDVGAEALWKMAKLARAVKEPETERALLLELWSAHPLAPEAAQVAEQLGGLEVPASSRAERGIALIDGHHNLAGAKVLKQALAQLPGADPFSCRARYAFGKGLRSARRHTRAQSTLRKVVAGCRDPELKVRALYVLGASESVVDPRAGVRTYRALVKQFPDHTYADDALFYASDLEQKLGRDDAARDLLEELARRHPSGDYAGEALFRAFWIEKEAGRADSALRLLDEIEHRFASPDEGTEIARERYWRARLYEHLGKKQPAEALMGAVARQDPTTYYGWLAETWLARAGVRESRPPTPDGTGDPLRCEPPRASSLQLREGVALLRLGLPKLAVDELAHVSARGLSRGEKTTWAVALDSAGDHRDAYEVAGALLGGDRAGPITSEDRRLWEIAYPNAFHDEVARNAKAADVPPALLQALIREESGLDPTVRSWAGAVGLSQLMLSTAQSVAARLHISNVTPARLKDPDFNLRIGAAYLGRLLKRFDGNLAFAVASYNAGGSAVNRWRRRHPGPTDAWVEQIPIEQTRRYVKRVLRSYQIYRLLYPKRYDADRGAARPDGLRRGGRSSGSFRRVD